jgi:putative acetyltransferase
MQIEVDDISRSEVLALLHEHMTNMYELSPPESVHALDVSKLKGAEITFWTAWMDGVLLGCAALKELTPGHGEVKSMRTPEARRGQGAGRALMAHIINVAKDRNYRLLSLETGSQTAFAPAQKLYESFGFSCCGPFESYKEDPSSVFMSLRLQARPA